MKLLAEIQYHMRKASVCNENGLVRLHLSMANESVQQLFVELNNRMLALESVGKQPEEIFYV